MHGRDPAACLVQNGRVVAYVEEERLIRFKHAPNIFPIRSIESCLRIAGLQLKDIDFIAYGYDAPRYSNGEIGSFYQQVNSQFPPDPATRGWQERNLSMLSEKTLRTRLERELLVHFGAHRIPELRFQPHHRSHAVATFFLSPFEEALVLTLDGSGDHQCTTLWKGSGNSLELIRELPIPHSLGWFYSAITEYLGFSAYDGEYKVMGLAAYGRENLEIRRALDRVLLPGPDGAYSLDLRYIHRGTHTYSDRFTDEMIDLLGIPPRTGRVPLTSVHEDLAFEAQRALEERVLNLLTHCRSAYGLKNICIGGGVGQNVKMNGRVHASGLFDNIFLFPIPSDSGTSVGAAMGLYHELTGERPQPLQHVYWGPSYSDEEILEELQSCGLSFEEMPDIAETVAKLIADGKIVGWFQAGMEGGPRALGARSILADPRDVGSRDRVNAAIKFREYWRPFCPSIAEESLDLFVERPVRSPFMIISFKATEHARRTVPAVVHVDGTVRIQTVDKVSNPRFHALLEAFEKVAGVPVVLNTSFNIKGEPIVCSPRDALRTFWATGLDALAVGKFLIRKPESPRGVGLQ
ncbi:MAG: carbamoyltransferase C-terminal domain-containing protein [Acidobacteriota bacterium]